MREIIHLRTDYMAKKRQQKRTRDTHEKTGYDDVACITSAPERHFFRFNTNKKKKRFSLFGGLPLCRFVVGPRACKTEQEKMRGAVVGRHNANRKKV